jgi:hypothetical protein
LEGFRHDSREDTTRADANPLYLSRVPTAAARLDAFAPRKKKKGAAQVGGCCCCPLFCCCDVLCDVGGAGGERSQDALVGEEQSGYDIEVTMNCICFFFANIETETGAFSERITR